MLSQQPNQPNQTIGHCFGSGQACCISAAGKRREGEVQAEAGSALSTELLGGYKFS